MDDLLVLFGENTCFILKDKSVKFIFDPMEYDVIILSGSAAQFHGII